ncbi:MAG: hypothetical protein AB7I30_04730 [Isosphaeraceae bacterium]
MRRLTRRTSLLIHSRDEDRLHPERLRALRLGIPQTTPVDWLREALQTRVGVVVVGGRRATVAAAMIGHVLSMAGADPLVALRTPVPRMEGSLRGGGSPYVVTDWPSDPAAVELVKPALLVLMDLPSDPAVDLDAWRSEFRRYVPSDPERRRIFARGTPFLDEGFLGEWFSFDRRSDWWGADLRLDVGTGRFRVFERGRYEGEVVPRPWGSSDAESALGAFVVCRRLGVPSSTIRAGIEGFTGLFRDFERRGSYRGVTLIDDSSAEPGAIRDVVLRARKYSGRRRLWVVLAPSAPLEGPETRELALALSSADRVVVNRPGDRKGRPLEFGDWRRGLAEAGVSVRGVTGRSELIAKLDEELEPGDVLLTIGSGEVGTIADAFIRRLPRDRQAG